MGCSSVRFLQSVRIVLRALHSSQHLMNTGVMRAKQPVSMPMTAESASAEIAVSRFGSSVLCLRKLLSLPLATLMALVVHFVVSKNEPPVDTRSYTVFLVAVLALSVTAMFVQP